MATFLQYWRKRKEVYCLYYVCGEEACLRELVISSIKEIVRPSVLDYFTHDGTDKIADIMDTLTREPTGTKKLVTIRNGHKIKKFDIIVKWAKQIKDFTETCLVVQTNEKKVSTKEDIYRPFVELGLFIECKSLAKNKLYQWLSTFTEMTPDAFDLLLESCGWELSKVINEVQKLKYLKRIVVVEDVISLCPRTYDERFVDKLLVGDKIGAKNALCSLGNEDRSKVIGMLDYKLNLLLQLVILRRQGVKLKDAVYRLGISFFIAKIHWDLCQTMTVAEIRKRLSLLVSIDTKVRAGCDGALAVLLVQW